MLMKVIVIAASFASSRNIVSIDLLLKVCMTHDVFYLTPIPSPNGKVWFKTTPMGINTLRSTVKSLCARSGVEGYKTNHSLRVTAATRLYHKGVDEQLIMERTGHRSLDGVRSYKRVRSNTRNFHMSFMVVKRNQKLTRKKILVK